MSAVVTAPTAAAEHIATRGSALAVTGSPATTPGSHFVRSLVKSRPQAIRSESYGLAMPPTPIVRRRVLALIKTATIA
jgi:hypothetical protein